MLTAEGPIIRITPNQLQIYDMDAYNEWGGILPHAGMH